MGEFFACSDGFFNTAGRFGFFDRGEDWTQTWVFRAGRSLQRGYHVHPRAARGHGQTAQLLGQFVGAIPHAEEVHDQADRAAAVFFQLERQTHQWFGQLVQRLAAPGVARHVTELP